MELELKMNAVNQIPGGTIIYREKDEVQSVCLVLKGRVLIQRKGIRTIVGSGNFLGICDLYSGKYDVTYQAVEAVSVYTFLVNSPEQIEDILSKNSEYGGLMVASINKYIKDIRAVEILLTNCASSVYRMFKVYYNLYKKEGSKSGYTVTELLEAVNFEIIQDENSIESNKVEYYAECASTPIDVQKAFYRNNLICLYHIDEQADVVCQLFQRNSEIADYIKELSELLYSDRTENLLDNIGKLIISMNQEKGMNTAELSEAVKNIVEKLKQVKKIMLQRAAISIEVEEEKLEKVKQSILSGEIEHIENNTESKQTINVKELNQSLKKIIEYSELEEAEGKRFEEMIDQFLALPDKLSTEDTVRSLRKQISKLYYNIYEKVFIKAYNDEKEPAVINMFLRYGLLDERMLTKEQLIELTSISINNDEQGPCNVYDMREWLTLIYEEKKLPSKSEFDMDYEEYIRSLKKSKDVTEEEANKMLHNPLKKLQYEIHNMFAYNNRLLSGQISTFVPFLYEDNFIGSIQQSLLTPDTLNATVRRLQKIDYSIFYREVLYSNEEEGITREYIVKEVYPDIILFPIAGSNAVMWQEFSGRKKDTKGRFFFSIFSTGRLEDNLIKLFGRFRWEVCRTTMGTAWNNIKYKSLTSEYMDYLQFYRKNRELTEEKREKLKAQIQKSRNNSKEVFVLDYETWVKNESQGAIRLNKVSREILAMYCPFAKDIREKIKNQPIFAVAMERFNREQLLKVKELELRQRMLVKEGVEIPQVIFDTEVFYKDM